MKVVLAGAFSKLGTDILIELCKQGHEVVAADMVEKQIEGCTYTSKIIDVRNPATVDGLCDGADVIISTIGLSEVDATTTHDDIDLNGNINLLRAAQRTSVKTFVYISIINSESASDVPLLHARYGFEEELWRSGLNYVIHRPTKSFEDVAQEFMPMIKKGEVTLYGKKRAYTNLFDTSDFAKFIVAHMEDDRAKYDVGGRETYSYEEIANLFFEAAGKEPVIKHASESVLDALIFVNKLKKNGLDANLKFLKWTMNNDMVGDAICGPASFREYVYKCYQEEK